MTSDSSIHFSRRQIGINRIAWFFGVFTNNRCYFCRQTAIDWLRTGNVFNC
ncbi:hypothetical protein MC7420_1269 [Coleofasciculus chthonoplastes PCC 7420]|uniref:Uncharacterized protein n=1 Tax=Coleofasciculus chthonoplastes PCC 7420 TaxID=118168 RepID=B4VRQ7_9CYAN|nr:hypothetical protein MC7420_1269 [Coleofasciculus chthonoplastes PCC 7420]